MENAMKVRVASAGTGKTTSLVLRYLELLASGVPLRRIAGVTFTRVAADELRQRVAEGVRSVQADGHYLGEPFTTNNDAGDTFAEARRELDGATLTTIHGFMIACLRLVAPQLGLDPNFSVLGEWEAQAIFAEELASLRYLAQDPSHALFAAFDTLDTFMSRPTIAGSERSDDALLQLFAARSLSSQLQAGSGNENRALLAVYEQVYKRYRLRLGGKLLPPSEVERWALLMVRSSSARARLAGRFRMVLVDEFQDVNPVQGEFFRALEQTNITIEVVGDPKQSIYGFRNADVDVFRRALREGEVQPSLDQTRRHSQVILRFLNNLTSAFSDRRWGFSEQEAPEVFAAGSQADVRGKVLLHWVADELPLAELRRYEAHILAQQLRELSRDYPLNRMAVLARSYSGLQYVEEALERLGLPYVLLQGRGYFERIEVRDIYHALRVGVEPTKMSLAAWLRSPFAGLDLAAVDQLLQADDPIQQLATNFPAVHARLMTIRQQVRGTPLEALKFLIREPFIDGQRYVEFLDSRARDNVDALLFTVAEQPPSNLEVLLERLERLSQQTDAGDVPQSGEGIALLTVHRAKGLEWDVLAVFDAGRGDYHPKQPVLVSPGVSADSLVTAERTPETGTPEQLEGLVCLQGSPDYERVYAYLKQRNEQESFRLLYVALSRARDVLLVTGSSSNGRETGWLEALGAINLGVNARTFNRADFVLAQHTYDARALTPLPPRNRDTPPRASTWLDKTFPLQPYPPVFSPSGLKANQEHEKLPFNDPEEGERLPGAGRTVGTLVHYAISQNWSPDNPKHLANLRAQEVMFPFSPSEQDALMADVRALLVNYQALLGHDLPALERRSVDKPELPMALSIGTTVWQGVIDRLYCADGVWYLEDYKTDQVVDAAQYYPQLAFYKRAIYEVQGVTPKVQLVFLRFKQVVVLEPEVLEAALLTISS
jgi:ATP-dependent exoDNAse (exonuclease V) beta subunit